jgi:hypothetical protein
VPLDRDEVLLLLVMSLVISLAVWLEIEIAFALVD